MERVAFFDVDETLISIKSMVSFLSWSCSKEFLQLGSLDSCLADLIALTKRGERERANEEYFKLFSGIEYAYLMHLGVLWYNEVSLKDFFHLSVLKKLKEHQNAGDQVVMVSGSFRPCLEPIAEALNVKALLCSELALKQGVITGQLTQQALGKNKAILASKYLADFPKNIISCAYADSLHDLPVLEFVDEPIVVGTAASELVKYAKPHSWECILL